MFVGLLTDGKTSVKRRMGLAWVGYGRMGYVAGGLACAEERVVHRSWCGNVRKKGESSMRHFDEILKISADRHGGEAAV